MHIIFVTVPKLKHAQWHSHHNPRENPDTQIHYDRQQLR
jgi:hypothetical protein